MLIEEEPPQPSFLKRGSCVRTVLPKTVGFLAFDCSSSSLKGQTAYNSLFPLSFTANDIKKSERWESLLIPCRSRVSLKDCYVNKERWNVFFHCFMHAWTYLVLLQDWIAAGAKVRQGSKNCCSSGWSTASGSQEWLKGGRAGLGPHVIWKTDHKLWRIVSGRNKSGSLQGTSFHCMPETSTHVFFGD